jgi:DNA-binding MurR/RpiR family transcriptional regulator
VKILERVAHLDQDKDLQYLLLTIKGRHASLPQAFRKLADYILANYDEAVYLNIKEIAARCGVSEGTVTNFVKSMGFIGFRDFKIAMARRVQPLAEDSILYGEINLNDAPDVLCEKVFHNNADAILKTLKILDARTMDMVADWMVKAKRIDIYGQSSSALAAMNAANRLLRIGVRTMVSEDPHMQVSSAALLKEGDVAIGVSSSGKSREVALALRTAREAGAHTVCITSSDDSPVAQQAEAKLFVSMSKQELLEDLPSRIAQMCVLDALYVCVAARVKKKALTNLHLVSDVLDEIKG